MTGTKKIPIRNLLLHISNVINACDLSSVTSFKVKQYLKHRFKDALPCENDLDIILERVIKNIKVNQALNNDSVRFEEGTNDRLDSNNAYKENKIKVQHKLRKKRLSAPRRRKIEIYVLKKSLDNDQNTCKAYSYSVDNPFTSKTVRSIKPFFKGEKGKKIKRKTTQHVKLRKRIEKEIIVRRKGVAGKVTLLPISQKKSNIRRKEGIEKVTPLPLPLESKENSEKFLAKNHEKKAESEVFNNNVEMEESSEEILTNTHEKEAESEIFNNNVDSDENSEELYAKYQKKRARPKVSKSNVDPDENSEEFPAKYQKKRAKPKVSKSNVKESKTRKRKIKKVAPSPITQKKRGRKRKIQRKGLALSPIPEELEENSETFLAKNKEKEAESEVFKNNVVSEENRDDLLAKNHKKKAESKVSNKNVKARKLLSKKRCKNVTVEKHSESDDLDDSKSDDPDDSKSYDMDDSKNDDLDKWTKVSFDPSKPLKMKILKQSQQTYWENSQELSAKNHLKKAESGVFNNNVIAKKPLSKQEFKDVTVEKHSESDDLYDSKNDDLDDSKSDDMDDSKSDDMDDSKSDDTDDSKSDDTDDSNTDDLDKWTEVSFDPSRPLKMKILKKPQQTDESEENSEEYLAKIPDKNTESEVFNYYEDSDESSEESTVKKRKKVSAKSQKKKAKPKVSKSNVKESKTRNRKIKKVSPSPITQNETSETAVINFNFRTPSRKKIALQAIKKMYERELENGKITMVDLKKIIESSETYEQAICKCSEIQG